MNCNAFGPIRSCAFASYYNSITITGMHYVYHNSDPFIIAIRRPNLTTHVYATQFLLSLATKSVPKKSIENAAYHLKRFLDFLQIWDIRLTSSIDPIVLFEGFGEYLRLLPKGKGFDYSIMWATVDRIPLSQAALSLEKSRPVGNVTGFHLSEQKDWHELSYETILQNVNSAMNYFAWLQKRTLRFRNLQVDLLPLKKIRQKSTSSSTAGDNKKTVNDVAVILNGIGIRAARKIYRPFNSSKLILPQKADWFISSIASPLDKLLFVILRYFGLRESEGADLMIDPTTIPNLRDPIAAKSQLKESLSGNLYWNKIDQFWVIDVTKSKTAAGIRVIPFLSDWDIGQDFITHLLYEALCERQRLLRHVAGDGKDECHLFVSKAHTRRGQPITGDSVYSKFHYLARTLLKRAQQKGSPSHDITKHSPHGLRHLFCTQLILFDPDNETRIVRLAGHENITTTKRIYFHVFEAAKGRKHGVRKMADTFAEFGETAQLAQEEFVDD